MNAQKQPIGPRIREGGCEGVGVDVGCASEGSLYETGFTMAKNLNKVGPMAPHGLRPHRCKNQSNKIRYQNIQ